jgi:oligopeptide/dipeptide ABC transporter ATP-binding protein
MFKIHTPEESRKDIPQRVIDMLVDVSINSPAETARRYPHQLSGGMLQRAMIAMSLACGKTKLLIADEPTTALDVTVQAQILELLKRLQKEHGMSVILITHDLGVVAETVDRVIVMYAGAIIESADVTTLFSNPRHPYTRGLIESLPHIGKQQRKGALYTIPGVVPNPLELKPGCKFMNRCQYAKAELCGGQEPQLAEIESGHHVRCVRVNEI